MRGGFSRGGCLARDRMDGMDLMKAMKCTEIGRCVGILICMITVGFSLNAGGDSWNDLLSGEDLTGWRAPLGDWQMVGDTSTDPKDETKLVPTPGTGTALNGPAGKTKHLITELEHGDIEAHIEFMVPKGSNSGVYFQGRYEIQVLDSWGVAAPTYSDCGGIYQRWNSEAEVPEGERGFEGRAPRVNAATEPGTWQSFDVVFHAPRFDAEGKKTRDAEFIRIVHNGKVIHEHVKVTGPTRSAAFADEQPLGPLMFQGDHGPVAYRNLRVRAVTGPPGSESP